MKWASLLTSNGHRKIICVMVIKVWICQVWKCYETELNNIVRTTSWYTYCPQIQTYFFQSISVPRCFTTWYISVYNLLTVTLVIKCNGQEKWFISNSTFVFGLSTISDCTETTAMFKLTWVVGVYVLWIEYPKCNWVYIITMTTFTLTLNIIIHLHLKSHFILLRSSLLLLDWFKELRGINCIYRSRGPFVIRSDHSDT